MTETESPSPPAARPWTAVLRDVLIGAAAGIGIAVLWVLLFLLHSWLGGTSSISVARPLRFLLLVLMLIAFVVGGGFVGYAVGGHEPEAAFWGCCQAYLLAFAVFGTWVQLNIGWANFFSEAMTAAAPNQETDSTRA